MKLNFRLSTALICLFAAGPLLFFATRRSIHYGSMSRSWGIEQIGIPIAVAYRDVWFAQEGHGDPAETRKVDSRDPWDPVYAGAVVYLGAWMLVAVVTECLFRDSEKRWIALDEMMRRRLK